MAAELGRTEGYASPDLPMWLSMPPPSDLEQWHDVHPSPFARTLPLEPLVFWSKVLEAARDE
eukprot:8338546-Lingulodinium_polyedra.AAC.1